MMVSTTLNHAPQGMLAERLEELAGGLPPSLADALRELPSSLAFQTADGSSGWEGQFAPLVLLYPLLQFPDSDIWDRAAGEDILFAHFLLLIHTIIEDRLVDGQLPFRPADYLLSKHLVLHAMRLLRGLLPDLGADGMIETFHELYIEAVAESGAHDASDAPHPPQGVLAAWAEQRALPGFLAVAVAARLLGRGEATIQGLRAAFNALALGLQFADDAEDWRDDLSAGRPNLAVNRSDLLPGTGGGLRIAQVRMESLAKASACIGRAAALQSDLDSPPLAAQLEQLLLRLKRRSDALLHELQTKLMGGLARYEQSAR